MCKWGLVRCTAEFRADEDVRITMTSLANVRCPWIPDLQGRKRLSDRQFAGDHRSILHLTCVELCGVQNGSTAGFDMM
jgi:hypothetical protein